MIMTRAEHGAVVICLGAHAFLRWWPLFPAVKPEAQGGVSVCLGHVAPSRV